MEHPAGAEPRHRYRARVCLSFARGLESPLPSYDQNVAASALRPTGSPGPPTSRSSGACASPPFRFSGICHRRRGREAASPATITSPCVPWPTSSPDTLPTTSRCCASDICRDFLPMPRSFAAFETVGKVGISVSAAQANAALKRLPHALSSAMQEEVHQRGNHQQCQQEAKDSPAAAGLRSDWGAVVGGHKASAVRVLGLNRAGWLEVLRVTER